MHHCFQFLEESQLLAPHNCTGISSQTFGESSGPAKLLEFQTRRSFRGSHQGKRRLARKCNASLSGAADGKIKILSDSSQNSIRLILYRFAPEYAARSAKVGEQISDGAGSLINESVDVDCKRDCLSEPRKLSVEVCPSSLEQRQTVWSR